MRVCLKKMLVAFTESIEANRAEEWFVFRIATADPSLHVDVVIVDDRFGILANGAALYRDRSPWADDTDGWVTTSIEVLESLLQSDLRIRVRRTMFGGSAGAIWVEREAAWNGDLIACRGMGTEFRLPAPWYRAAT